jgi:hypothetical protein
MRIVFWTAGDISAHGLSHGLVPLGRRMVSIADLTRALIENECDVAIIDIAAIREDRVASCIDAVARTDASVLVYAPLGSEAAVRIHALAAVAPLTVVLVGSEAGALLSTMPAVGTLATLQHQLAQHLCCLDEDTQAICLEIFARPAAQRNVGQFVQRGLVKRRRAERSFARSGLVGLATLLLTARVARACDLLRARRSVTSTAEMVGMNIQVLGRACRDLLGVSPRDCAHLSAVGQASKLAGANRRPSPDAPVIKRVAKRHDGDATRRSHA